MVLLSHFWINLFFTSDFHPYYYLGDHLKNKNNQFTPVITNLVGLQYLKNLLLQTEPICL